MSHRYTPFDQYAAAARDGDFGYFIHIDPDEYLSDDSSSHDPEDTAPTASSGDCVTDEFLCFCALSSPSAVISRRQPSHNTNPTVIRYIPLTFAAAAPAA
ncbi:MAG: hypothetical protein NC117_03430 [Pseudoflavonifractor sp.]|nr:hypothetical protein [Pseudoflavonifractor sp.]